jgi:hypothetical protein
MAKRRLVEINNHKHRKIEMLRRECKASGVSVPTVPFIVDAALDIGLKEVLVKFTPPKAA